MGRLTSKPSKWFKDIRSIGVVLVTAAAAIIAAPATLGVSIPAGVLLAAKIIAVAGASAGVTAHTANDNE